MAERLLITNGHLLTLDDRLAIASARSSEAVS
jgi:hypothetical protein